MIKIYRKTAAIKAEQLTQDNINQLKATYGIKWNYEYECYQLEEKYMILDFGDWIATGVDGEHWPIADEIFKKTYAGLPVIPKAVADWIEECKRDGQAFGYALYEDNFPEEVKGYFRDYYTRDQWIALQDTFARAWLDGYQIEGDETNAKQI